METKIVPLREGRLELAACKAVRRLPRYRELFAPAEAWGEVDGFALLRFPSLPAAPPDYAQLLRCVQALQKVGVVHRRITAAAVRAEGILADFSAALEVRTAFARAAEVFYETDEGPVDLRLLGAAAQHGLTRPVLEEVCGEAADLYEKYLGVSREAAVRGLLAGWRTWDLYSVARLFPGRAPLSLHPDPARRPSVAQLLKSA